MADDSSRILDLLFDQNEGVLKEELPEIHTVDFSSLGLMTGDFDDFLLNGSLFKDDITEQKKLAQRQAGTYTDHDYVLQKSPAHSDSGVSLDSGSSSPRPADDPSHVYSDANSLSDSPRSVSQLSTHMSDNQSEFSPTMVDQSESSPLGLEDFDMSDINFDNLDTIDSSALEDGGGLDLLDTDDVSIDVGMHSDLMTFDTTTIPTHNSDGTTTKMIKIIKVAPQAKTNTLPFTMKDVSTTQESATSAQNFPDLRLTDEEQDLLAKEGVVLPSNMPLTKEEERALKAVRRKIRNKISAKESRKRKMDYVGGLEKRVKLCTQENQHLQKKVQDLEQKNVSLISQLKKLQSLIAVKTTKTAQASTCVMVLLLSFAFLIVPNFNPFGSKNGSTELKSIPMPGKSRSLLHTSGNAANDANNPYGLTMRPAAPWEMTKTQVVPKVEGAFPTPSEDMLDELSEKKVEISAQNIDILDTNISVSEVGGHEQAIGTKPAQKQKTMVVPNQRQDL